MLGAGESRVPGDHVLVQRADANEALPGLLQSFDVRDYLLVFADCEAPKQWPWSSVEALRAQGHQSVDLYMLFPLEMGINRLLAYTPAQRDRYGHIMTRFFGTEAWRAIVEARRTEEDAPRCRRELEELYLSRLRGLWRYAHRVAHVRLRGNQGLYRMLFASDHEAGDRIARWARGRADRVQQLPLL
jgi:three-Cys-motif partner protein